MIYGYDQAVQLPVRDLYDSGMMQMAIGAAKDMYDRGEKRLDDIYAFQDFYSPIAKDVDYVYNNTIGKAKAKIDELYAKGIDPLRSAEGRAAIASIKRGINYAEIAKRKESAKNAEEYMKAVRDLQKNGWYSPELAALEGKGIDAWDTSVDGVFNRTSPTKIVDTTTFTDPFFANLQPIVVNESKKGKKIKKTIISPEMLEKRAAENFTNIINTPQGALMYKKHLQEATDPVTGEVDEDEAVTAMMREIVASQGKRLRNEVESDDNFFNFRNLELSERAADRADRAQELAERQQTIADINSGIDENGDGYFSQEEKARAAQRANENASAKAQGSGRRTSNTTMADIFQYGEATQEAAIGRFVQNIIGNVDKLKRNPDGTLMVDSKGRPVVETDASGKPKKVPVNDASVEEVMHAYNKYGFARYKDYIQKLQKKYANTYNEDDPTSGLVGSNAFNEFLNTFGYNDGDVGWQASMGKKMESDGTVKYSAGDFNNMYTDAELMGMAKGYAKRGANSLNHEDEVIRSIAVNAGEDFGKSDANKARNILKGLAGGGKVEGLRSGVNSPNKIGIILKDGRLQMFRAVNINFGDSNTAMNSGRLWIPVGSPTLPQITGKNEKGQTTARFVPYTDEMDSMSQIEENALFSKAIGAQGNKATD